METLKVEHIIQQFEKDNYDSEVKRQMVNQMLNDIPIETLMRMFNFSETEERNWMGEKQYRYKINITI